MCAVRWRLRTYERGGVSRTQIFHITHLENLPGVAARGLVCDRLVPTLGRARSIAYSDIKARRAATSVPVGPGGTLADYVPFYFAPRSPMLYTISQGNVPGAVGAQPHIAHLVLSAEAVATAGHDFVFTDGHAVIAISRFYDDLAKLTELDWQAIRTRNWGTYYDPTDETKRKKQSEFLVHRAVPWHLVEEIGVMDAKAARAATESLDGVAHVPPITVRPDWYYW